LFCNQQVVSSILTGGSTYCYGNIKIVVLLPIIGYLNKHKLI